MTPVSRSLFRRAAACVITVLAFAGVAATPALANYHEYCHNGMNDGETCPPNGSSEWRHLTENFGEGFSGSVCIDEYLDPNNNGSYTGQSCGRTTAQYPGGTWGYPRVWNNTGYQTVVGVESF